MSTQGQIVGVARVVREAYPDPKAKGEDWTAVDVGPAFAMSKPVTLETMKKDAKLAGFQLLTHSRLSVVPVSAAHFDHIPEAPCGDEADARAFALE